ncbi:MAG: FadR/GntR family transcriptional regulator [Alphaproteobacteria bacterium]
MNQMRTGPALPDPATALSGNERATVSSVYRALLRRIADGSLRPGGRLPNERDLAAQLKVGRSTVRGALALMEQQGLVTRRVGSGTFLADDARDAGARLDLTPIPTHASVPDFLEILEGRLLFEPALMTLVAARASDQELAGLDGALATIAAAPSWLEFKEAIYALHGRMFAGGRNRFMVQVFEEIVKDRRAVRYDGRNTGLPVPEQVRAQTCRDLALIVKALQRRDGAQAEKAMRDHLLRTLATVNLYC